jgi:hypothetical protein
MRTEPYISYFLPKGTDTVSLRKRRPRPAYEIVRAWLAETTVYRFGPTIRFSLTIPVTDQNAGVCLAWLDQEFGVHRIAGGESTWPDEVEISEFWEWVLPHERLFDLFDAVESNLVPFAAYGYSIGGWAHFLLVDEKGQVLPGQSLEEPDGFHSRLLLCFCDKSWMAPDLRFPFARDGDEFRRVWEAFKATAPFHLNDKYLRIARVKNERIILRKL